MNYAVALALLAACGDNLPARSVNTEVAQVTDVSLQPAAKLDLMILMDDTVGLPEVQDNLRQHAAEFLHQLEGATGTLPSLHIGIATSDMGATGSDAPTMPGPDLGQVGNGGCSMFGKDGALLVGFGAGITGSYLTDDNYTGALDVAFGNMLRVGGGGCGLEQHLRGLERALTRPDNAGFLRDDAALAILIVADEDDCSVRDPRVFSPTATDLGPVDLRCTRHGVVCNEDLTTVGTKTGCTTAEDSQLIRGIQPAIEMLERVRPRERMVVAGIIGNAEPFVMEQRTPPGGGTAVLTPGNVCGEPAVSGAVYPTVRLGEVLEHFEARGHRSTICGQDLGDSFLDTARAFEQLLGAGCIDLRRLADSSDAEGIQPACEAYLARDGQRLPVPMCPADGACVELVEDRAACGATPYVRARLRDSEATAGQLQVYCERPGGR